MKLELRDLAPYLPYKLKLYCEGSSVEIQEMKPFDLTEVMIIFMNRYQKPILRPLSDLTKEIEINGRTFNPYNTKILDDLMMATSEWDCLCEYTGDLSKNVDIPYYIVVQLFEWHFDVFGLIPQGLAIDINTLNPNTN